MSRQISRRTFIGGAASALPVLAWPPAFTALQRAPFDVAQRERSNPWAQADAIVRSIRLPRFPSREFPITAFGAVGDGAAMCTDAIHKAIGACRAAGGGHVVVPAGRFLTGPFGCRAASTCISLRMPTLAFSHDAHDYLPVVFTRWEGVEVMNYSPFIYAFEAENIAITGPSTLDGQAGADHWWNWRGTGPSASARQTTARTRLFEMQAKGVPVAERVFGDGHFLRPNFIQPYRSRNVLIEDVTIVNSPMWEIHPVLCQSAVSIALAARSRWASSANGSARAFATSSNNASTSVIASSLKVMCRE
jgi:polygalacturonase